MLTFADKIDCANPLRWTCPMNRGLIGDYSYVPGLANENRRQTIAAEKISNGSVVHDLTRLPGGVVSGLISNINAGVHGVPLGGGWGNVSGIVQHSNRPGGFGKTWSQSGAITDGIALGGYNSGTSRYMFLRATPFSAMAWVRVSTVGQDQGIITNIWDGVTTVGWEFKLTVTTGVVTFRMMNTTATAGRSVSTTRGLTTNTWYHVAFTYDGSNTAAGIKLYINGNPEPTTTNLDTDSGELTAAVPQIGVGAATAAMSGCLDQVRVHSYALTPWEVQTFYQETYSGSWEIYNRVRTWVGSQEVNATLQANGLSYCAGRSTGSPTTPLLAFGRTVPSTWSRVVGASSTNITVRGASRVAAQSVGRERAIASVPNGMSDRVVSVPRGNAARSPVAYGLAREASQVQALPAVAIGARGSDRVSTSDAARPYSGAYVVGVSEVPAWDRGRSAAASTVVGVSEVPVWDRGNERAVAAAWAADRTAAESQTGRQAVANAAGRSFVSVADAAIVTTTSRAAVGSDRVASSAVARSTSSAGIVGVSEAATSDRLGSPRALTSGFGSSRAAAQSRGGITGRADARGLSHVAVRSLLAADPSVVIVTGTFDIDFELEVEPLIAVGQLDVDPLLSFEIEIAALVAVDLEVEQP